MWQLGRGARALVRRAWVRWGEGGHAEAQHAEAQGRALRARGSVRSRGLRWRRAGGGGVVGRRLLSACRVRSAPEGWVGGRGVWALCLVYGAVAGGAGLCEGVKGRWGALPGMRCDWGAVEMRGGGTSGAWVGYRAH